ncbi:Golgi-associated plant pathogenesis-related protein 1-like [Dreissena polymorpha]|nr:Golgi-associated plant pathogenesis-related protein 1-like [Dreissena polymorpha]
MMIHSNCTLSDDSQIGENIYMCWTSNGGTVPKARDAVRSWYNEILHYNFGCPEFSFKTGHFTQVVWRDTKLLGIAWARSSEGGIYVVANYAPAGNVHGAFGENVSQLISAGIEKAPLDDRNNNSIDVEEEA